MKISLFGIHFGTRRGALFKYASDIFDLDLFQARHPCGAFRCEGSVRAWLAGRDCLDLRHWAFLHTTVSMYYQYYNLWSFEETRM